MKYRSLYILTAVSVGLLTMTSCLKDLEDHYGAFSSVPPVVELSENPNAGTMLVERALAITGEPADLLVRVNIAAVHALDKDVTVTIDTVKANLTAFNAARAAEAAALTPPGVFVPYEFIPDSLWNFVSKTVTVPKGTREVDMVIKINTHKFNPSKKYVLPLEIKDAQGLVISGNYGKQFIGVMAKNKYHGSYLAQGVIDFPPLYAGGAGVDRVINVTKAFSTVSGNVVNGNYADLGGSGYKYDLTVTTTTLTVGGKSVFRVVPQLYVSGVAPATGYVYSDTFSTYASAGATVIDHNYAYEITPGKWFFRLKSQYNASAPRHVWEDLTMY
jgi:hypothetical protein